ncbi:hypothetical protein CARUB_v10002389mg [Capsella rubella]|uniref:Uncharacterized protein n=1 Tax=Capsella rubella TaxID=81985 RepID=R0FHR9_9BRAS|nr:hypothetical protein CARUB_v10002389mg [Capsella rubella]
MAQKGSFSDYTPSSIKYAYANSSNYCEAVTLLLKYLGGAKHNWLFLIKVININSLNVHVPNENNSVPVF